MPTYTYYCETCKCKFELFAHFSNYSEHPICTRCSSEHTCRSYQDDVSNVACSIRKHSSELKTVGDLANRNRDSLRDDQKLELYHKHNAYKENSESKPLPKGMSRIKKPKNKTKWTQ